MCVGKMQMWVARATFAILAEMAAADYLHMMQRHVVLSEEGTRASLLQDVKPCKGVDCDLSKRTGRAPSTAGEDVDVDEDWQSKLLGQWLADAEGVGMSKEKLANLKASLSDVLAEAEDGAEDAKFDKFFLAHKAAVDERLAASTEAKKQERSQKSDPVHVYPPRGAKYVKWSLCNASLHSNLGGLGPDAGEEAIRYFSVAEVVDERGSSHSLDLVVEAIGEYKAKNVDLNGLLHGDTCFGNINVKSNKTGTNSVTVHFNWYLAGTTTPVVISKQYLTWYDIDGGKKTSEAITFYNRVRRLYISENTTLKQSGQLDSGLTISTSGLIDNVPMPDDPENLTDQQKDRAVTVSFLEKSQFKITFSVTGGRGGRNFAFTGHSLLANLAADGPIGEDSCTDPGTCSIYEDPHIKVFDGLQISLLETQKKRVLSDYGAGDMWLVRSPEISIQGKYLPDPDLKEKNLFVRSVAIGGPFLNGSTFIVGPLDGSITWDGASVLESQTSDLVANLGKGVMHAKRHLNSHLVQDMSQRNAGVDIDLPTGVKVTVNRFKKHVNVFIAMPPAVGGQDGLCGNFNCRTSDDTLDMILRYRNPRVPRAESLFED